MKVLHWEGEVGFACPYAFIHMGIRKENKVSIYCGNPEYGRKCCEEECPLPDKEE